ncbi:hypothetical protein BCR37DRAFT_68807 [Protomyces lactucae-debilis]|uniref:ML-like domain-containing protein n=1 Tax=Protomyces lactucae-debilis TaxID=2754530 RepID=A0A1Y2F9X8_PROLT|nr:uncharacterized protein BCR37DRAFT_68807 [Protomyces lactucae-debilis]ORY80437.1 hypothetical protein BCR37DRAFT_68807 [Protomyces lactucae-debilis]
MTGQHRSSLVPFAGLLWLLLICATAAQSNLNLTFTNCLNPRSRNASTPLFTPLRVVADLNTTSQRLRFSIYGNVTGSIADTNEENTLASALTNTIEVSGYTQRRVEERLCNISYNDAAIYAGARVKTCPVGPGLAHLEFETPLDFGYTFSSITNTIRINDPASTNYEAGCLQVTVTPPFPDDLDAILTYVPLAILILVGIKVVLVAVLNPWSGTLDPYRSFSNFGMDTNALRMATPGFSDCLAYIQFAAYTSMLRLSYPGFFQLATSRFAWSLLLFESSPITKALNFFPQRNSDIASFINHVGAARQDAWRSFMIWFLIIEACVAALVGILVGLWWLLTPSSTDLTMKNLPFLGGCLLRIYYWLLLPLSLFTCYQLVTAQQSNAGLVASAALVLMIFVVLFPVGLLIMLPRHQPQQDLFEDISLLNLWGPLYNTYSESAILVWIPNMILLIARGMVVGLLINYGTAQIVLLIAIEALNVAVIFWKRPWPATTNTTIVQLIMSSFRIVILFLMVPFIPSLNIEPGQREWIGYIVLIFHAIVMIFLVLGNCLLTLLELAIRLLVIVPQDEGAKVIFGARQLRSRRRPKQFASVILGNGASKDHSMSQQQSFANLLEAKEDSPFFRRPRHGTRAESIVGTTQHRASTPTDVLSMNGESITSRASPLDPPLSGDVRSSSYVRVMPSESFLLSPSRPHLHSRPTSSTTHIADAADKLDSYELTLAPTEDAERRGVDYAVREADIYHPQNSGELLGPSKKLGTGPADPAGVHFRRFNWTPWRRTRRNPEKGKFVVVRSSPAMTTGSGAIGTSGSALQRRSSSLTSTGQPVHLTSTETSRVGPASPTYDIQEQDEEEYDSSPHGLTGTRPSIKIDTSNYAAFDSVASPDSFEMISPSNEQMQARLLNTQHARQQGTGSSTSRETDASSRATDQMSTTADLAMLLQRPTVGDRVDSYRSHTSHGSVPSARVSSAVRTGPGVQAGRSAQLINLDLDA